MPFLGVPEILQRVLNASEDRLKVDINATVTAGAVEVAIDQTTDSIKIGDGTDLMAVNADGSINVVVSGGGGSTTVSGTVSVNNITGTVVLPTGASTAARQDTGNTSLASIDGKITTCNTGAVVVSSSALPSGAATDSTLTGGTQRTKITDGTDNVGISTVGSAKALKVDVVQTAGSTLSYTTATHSNVSASANSVTLLSLNTSRLSASFFNDSASAVYIKFGETASTTSFVVKLFPYEYFNLPSPIFTGRIDAIWDTATGAMRCLEGTA